MENTKRFYFSNPVPETSQESTDPYFGDVLKVHADWKARSEKEPLSNFTKSHIYNFIADSEEDPSMSPGEYSRLDRYARDVIEIIDASKHKDLSFWEELLDVLMDIASKKLSIIITNNI